MWIRRSPVLWQYSTMLGMIFSRTYVIAHEIDHHVQNVSDFNKELRQVRHRDNETGLNEQPVLLPSRIDDRASVWIHYGQNASNIFEDGDPKEAANAATQVGNVTLQFEARSYKVPECYTEGKSAQRLVWFCRRMTSGDLNGCVRLAQQASCGTSCNELLLLRPHEC